MEALEKKLLTDEIVWRDLLEIKYQKQGSSMSTVIAFMALAMGSLGCIALAIALAFEVPQALWLFLPLAVLLALPLRPLYRQMKQRQSEALSVPVNSDLLIYDWDICIDKKRGYGDDPDLLVFGNPHKEVCSDLCRYPMYHTTEVNDKFFVVSLKGYPNVFRYYSMNEWHLGDPSPEESAEQI